MKKCLFSLVCTAALGTAVANENTAGLYVWPKYSQDVIDRVSTFLEGETFDQWNLGSIYDEAPQKYADLLGANYGFFCNSGTSGLHASLMAIGLKRGDRVAVPALTFICSVTPLVHTGVEPVLVDVDPATGNLDPAALRKIDDPGIKAVVVVHMWGVPAHMSEIKRIAEERGWKIIEDFSHAHFSKTDSRYVGSIGDVGFCSLQRKKTISVGEGGLIVTNDEETFLRIRQIVAPGSFDNPPGMTDFSGFGLNMRMAPTSAVLAEALLGHVGEMVATRSGSARRLMAMMARYPDVFELPVQPEYAEEVSWYALRPRSHVPLERLKEAAAGTRWRFGALDCPMIADHIFWNKDRGFYPFSTETRIVNPKDPFPGARRYSKGRISVGVPNLTPAQWTDEEALLWEEELARIVESVR
jgi:dTDP-4-amino-4,6-dideoxygalactose transaminase